MAPDRRASSSVTDDGFVRCRTFNHAWDEFFPIDLEPPSFGWRLSLRCVRCATERHDMIDFKGQVMGRRYLYPHGYQWKDLRPGETAPGKEVFREELFDRLRAQLEQSHSVGAAPAEVKGEVIPIKAAKAARARKQA